MLSERKNPASFTECCIQTLSDQLENQKNNTKNMLLNKLSSVE